MTKLAEGSCLCGKVSYQITDSLNIFQYCYCSRCQKFTGSAHASNLLVAPESFAWLSGTEWIGRYEHPDAKHFATCFCKNCGSSMPWLSKRGRSVIIPAGTLDTDPMVRPKWNIFCHSKASWYVAPVELPSYAELPSKVDRGKA
ncbi:MAG: hypothetical protein ACJA04_000400 [Cellvibrionaceae bacterium]|jgi:hypothetical protein